MTIWLPKVSVVIPVYNQAFFVGEAIQSVIDQTYHNIEIIVVNDASTDNISQVINKFSDPRIKYIVHKENKMLPAARNTGIRASSGEIIGFLDADDQYHPQKLERHVRFLENNPTIGITYNSRFEIDLVGNLLRIFEAPPTVGLSDFVLGFPFTPSEMIARREWLFRVHLYDESYLVYSEDLDIYCRLALAGGKFANVGGHLNYRRRHPGRAIHNISGRLEGVIRALETTFSDPRCPIEVLELRSEALGKSYVIWSYWAYAQNETTIGKKFLRLGFEYNQSYLDNEAQKFLDFLVFTSVRNGDEHEIHLNRIFLQLPQEFGWLQNFHTITVARGYLHRGVREIIWKRPEKGKQYLEKAASMGVNLDEEFLKFLTATLINYESEFGPEATQDVIQNLSHFLDGIGTKASIRWLKGNYYFNMGLNSNKLGKFSEVPSYVLKAAVNNPGNLCNRGMLSILSGSILNSVLPSIRG